MSDTHYAEDISNLWRYLNTDEVALLKRYAAIAGELSKKPVIVNIGAGTGTSGLAFREGNMKAHIFTVDYCESGPIGSLEGERNAFANTGLETPTQFLGLSYDVGKEWDRGDIHLLFIDGGHERKTVIADIESWVPHVVDKGYILFHDYGFYLCPDVKPVVDEIMIPKHDLIEIVGNMAVFRKRKKSRAGKNV